MILRHPMSVSHPQFQISAPTPAGSGTFKRIAGSRLLHSDSRTLRRGTAAPNPFVGLLGLAWLRSLRIGFTGAVLPRSGILALWHEDFLLCLPAFARRGMRVLISRSRDGDWAAWACGRFGYGTARGSSSRGGASALQGLARELIESGGWAVLVVDGPRGPARKSKPGALWLSQTCGVPIVAAAARAEPSIRLRNWDRTRLPAPFARVTVALAAPGFPQSPEELDLEMAKNAGALRLP
jgi:lysophospholipid acyltransferase (LPLAT)-like uncharacterized protein